LTTHDKENILYQVLIYHRQLNKHKTNRPIIQLIDIAFTFVTQSN